MAYYLNKDHLKTLHKCTEKFIQCLDAFNDKYKESEDGYRYLASQQYDDEVADYYEDSLARKSRVYNLVWAQFNTLYGNFIGNKMKINIRPGIGGTPEVSTVLEDMKKHVSFDNQMTDIQARWLLAGFVRCGYIYPRYTDENRPDGSVVISNLDEFDICFDPEAKDPLLKDSEFWFRSQWMSREDIIHRFPKHKKQIESMLTARENMSIYDLMEIDSNLSGLIDNRNVVQENGGTYRVVEYHYFKYHEREMAINTSTGEQEEVKLSGKKRAAYLTVNPSVKIIGNVTFKEKRIKTYVPGIMFELSDVESNLQDETHDLIPLSVGQNYVKKARNSYGIFRVLRDSQDAFNEFSNINEDLAKKTARPKKIVKPDKIKNYQQFESTGDQPGFTIEADETVDRLADVYDEKIPPIPNVAEQVRQSIVAFMPHISGITANLSGHQEGSAENASLFAQRVQQGQQGFQPYFAAYRQSSKFLWEKVIALIQQNYTSQRIVKIYDQTPYGVNDRNVVLNMKVGEQIINDVTVGAYKVIVDDNFGDQTSRMRRFVERVELSRLIAELYGPAAVDPEWLLSETEIENAGEIIENIRNAQQAQAEAMGQQAELENAERVQKMALDKAQVEDAGRPEITETIEQDEDGRTKKSMKTVQ